MTCAATGICLATPASWNSRGSALITAAYASKYPEHVEALCLLAVPAARSQQDRQAAAALLANLRTQGVKHTMSTLVKSWYTEEFLAQHPAAVRDRLSQLDEIDDDVFIRTYELYNGIDIDPWLHRIVAPSLIMTGELARGSGADAGRFIASRLSNSKLVLIEGLKNGILTEVPVRVAAEIRDNCPYQASAGGGHAAHRRSGVKLTRNLSP